MCAKVGLMMEFQTLKNWFSWNVSKYLFGNVKFVMLGGSLLSTPFSARHAMGISL